MKYFSIYLFIFVSLPFETYSQTFSHINIEKFDQEIDLANFDYNLLNIAVKYQVNIHREKHRKIPLKYNLFLGKSALSHSSQMKKYNFFNHYNKYNRKLRTLEDRAKISAYLDYSYLAENIYYGFIQLGIKTTYNEISKEIVHAFIKSKSHNINLLEKKAKEIGGSLVFEEKSKNGFLYYYYTQSFGASHP